MTKDIKKQTYKYIRFEINRLRTRWDNEKDKDIRNKIAKRYLRLVEEFNRRSDNWFWTPHELDRIIGKAGTFQGHKGKWITLENGQHIFIREGESVNDAIGRMKPSKVDYIAPNVKDPEFSKKIAKRIFSELPSKQFEGIDTINITAEKKDNAAGTYRYPGILTVREDYLLDDDIARAIVYHEVGHHVYAKTSGRHDWVEFWNGNKGIMPNDYSKTNPNEGFAESYTKYYRGKAKSDIYFVPLPEKIENWFKKEFGD